MPHSVLALVHGSAPHAATAMLGGLAGAFARCGHDVGVASFTDPGQWPRPRLKSARMLVVLGSLDSAVDDTLPWLDEESRFLCAALRSDIPVLGICFGAQLLARLLGGRVEAGTAVERGLVRVRSDDSDRVPGDTWYAHHRDRLLPPAEATVLAESDSCVQAFAHGPHLGVQFHPEMLPATVDAWRAGFRGTHATLDPDDPGWSADRDAIDRSRAELTSNTRALVRGFVREAARRPELLGA